MYRTIASKPWQNTERSNSLTRMMRMTTHGCLSMPSGGAQHSQNHFSFSFRWRWSVAMTVVSLSTHNRSSGCRRRLSILGAWILRTA